VLNRAREVLVLCRPTGVHLLPTETTEPGETLLQTLARGLAEEAGATASLVRYLGATEMPFSWDGHPYERPSSGTN
jgi:ADP-ribose pyrophosphatase YjhB (NUDIX family)